MSERSQFRLLGERRFGPFFATQLLGAFNDNVFKNALIILVAFQTAGLAGLAPEVTVNLAAGLFILPFFLLSATAGQLADKYDKARIMRVVKLAEVGIMTVAAVGFIRGDIVTLLVALFLMGTHATVFGPAKYSILPQTLDERELVGGNALVETGTWAAILFGTILGGLLVARLRREPVRAAGAAAGAGARAQLEPDCRDVAQPPIPAPEPNGVPVDPGRVLVLVLRGAPPRPVPGVRENLARRRCRGGDGAPRGPHGRHRRGLARLRAHVGP
jgi:MFS family permease